MSDTENTVRTENPCPWPGLKRACQDHTGRWFKTRREMYRFWETTESICHSRITRGWTLEEALTGEREGVPAIVDHEGRRYPSVRALCRTWGITEFMYRDRLARGLSLEEVLTQPRLNDVTVEVRIHVAETAAIVL